MIQSLKKNIIQKKSIEETRSKIIIKTINTDIHTQLRNGQEPLRKIIQYVYKKKIY